MKQQFGRFTSQHFPFIKTSIPIATDVITLIASFWFFKPQSNFQTHIIENSNSFKKKNKRNSYLLSVCAFFAVHSRVLNSNFLGKSHTDLFDLSL